MHPCLAFHGGEARGMLLGRFSAVGTCSWCVRPGGDWVTGTRVGTQDQGPDFAPPGVRLNVVVSVWPLGLRARGRSLAWPRSRNGELLPCPFLLSRLPMLSQLYPPPGSILYWKTLFLWGLVLFSPQVTLSSAQRTKGPARAWMVGGGGWPQPT